MELTPRDLEVLTLTGRFAQLSSTHITELIFADRSHTVPDKALGRLTRSSYLSRVGRRASSDKGGAGAFVYQLGRFGRALLDVEGRPSNVVNNHALMVVDTYLELRRAERTGVLALKDWNVEQFVPPVIRADLFAALDFPQQGRSSAYYLEIDMGTEAPKRIRDKVAGYWRAVESNTAEWFPYVVFVVRHEARKKELTRVLRELPEEWREMVRVYLIAELILALLAL